MDDEEHNTERALRRDETIIELENVHKTYLLGVEGIPALRGVSLGISRGEFCIIYGTSGGGKSTLLNICGCIDKPTKGSIRIFSTRVGSSTPDSALSQIRLNRLGFVFQTFNLLSSLSAVENVEMPMVLAGRLTRAERRDRAVSLLGKVGLKHRLDHLPSQLSGGEQQRVTIARAIANEPDILLLDEPTGDLDSLNTLIVMDMLYRLNMDEKITMVMVTHDPNLKRLASRVIFMRDGKIQREERISERARMDEYNRLRGDLATLLAERSRRVQPSERAEESEAGAQQQIRFTTRTEIRQPADYATFQAQSVVSGSFALAAQRRTLSLHSVDTNIIADTMGVRIQPATDAAVVGVIAQLPAAISPSVVPAGHGDHNWADFSNAEIVHAASTPGISSVSSPSQHV